MNASTAFFTQARSAAVVNVGTAGVVRFKNDHCLRSVSVYVPRGAIASAAASAAAKAVGAVSMDYAGSQGLLLLMLALNAPGDGREIDHLRFRPQALDFGADQFDDAKSGVDGDQTGRMRQ